MSAIVSPTVRRTLAAAFVSFAILAAPAGAQQSLENVEPGAALVTTAAVVHIAGAAGAVTPVALTRRLAADGAQQNVDAPAPAPRGFAASGFAQFMSSPAGRATRIIAGLAMIGGGIAMDNNAGTVLAIAGGVPLAAGMFDVCFLSPVLGGPLKGADIRAAKR
jgi:hypothetical protein